MKLFEALTRTEDSDGKNLKLKKGEAAIVLREGDFSLLLPKQEPGEQASEPSLTAAMLAFVLVNEKMFQHVNEAFERELHEHEKDPKTN
jgi:hypothetical protein